ncbi:MAG: hypothetical protein AB7Q97_13550 [Gammaproteobacteria bacterium]
MNAADNVLEGIEIEPDPKGWAIRIQTTTALRVISAAPQKRGDQIRIQVQPLPTQLFDPCSLVRSQSLLWSANASIPLTEVEYQGDLIEVTNTEGDPLCRGGEIDSRLAPQTLRASISGTAEIVLHFNHPVWYVLEPTGDPRHLVVTLLGAGGTEVEIEPVPEGEPEIPEAPHPSSVPPGPQSDLIDAARRAILDKDYDTAIGNLNKVLEVRDTPLLAEALELLGLARERKGQLALAKAAYDQFLLRFPEGEPARRVKQRLDGLVTAEKSPKQRLRQAQREQRSGAGALPGSAPPRWETNLAGGVSQDYRRENVYAGSLTAPLESSLETNVDINAQFRDAQYDIRSRASAGYRYDFLEGARHPSTRVSSLYVDLATRARSRSMRIGRQTLTSGGVLGRFDGGTAGFRLGSALRLNVVAGLPVRSSVNTEPDAGTYFVGANFDIGTFAKSLDFNVFAIEQVVDGLVDRRAIGAEMRYFRPNQSLFSLVDYDVSYGDLNAFMLLGTHVFQNRSTASIAVDYRSSPVLTTTNALQGQLVETIGDLNDVLDEGDIRSLARDRTAKSRTITLGGTWPFSDRFQINADISNLETTGTPASGAIPASPGTGMQWLYATQLVASNLLKTGDSAVVGFRYGDFASTRRYTALMNGRSPLTGKVSLNAQIRLDRSLNDIGTDDWRLSPRLRLIYRMKRNVQFEFETGGEWSRQGRLAGGYDRFQDYFVQGGYRADF